MAWEAAQTGGSWTQKGHLAEPVCVCVWHKEREAAQKKLRRGII